MSERDPKIYERIEELVDKLSEFVPGNTRLDDLIMALNRIYVCLAEINSHIAGCMSTEALDRSAWLFEAWLERSVTAARKYDEEVEDAGER